jgi:hypothetical protein
MKSTVSIFGTYALLCFSVIWSNCGRTQSSILDQFIAEQFDGKVILSWTIAAGNSCNGITVFRSTDSLNYSEIGDISGVCGHVSLPVSYSFTDDNPSTTGTNYYRLDLGGVELSYSVAVDVMDLNGSLYKLVPNPINSGSAQLYFANPTSQLVTFYLFSAFGQLLEVMHTNQDVLSLSTSNWSPGSYFFSIVFPYSTQRIGGKLSMQ